MDCDFGSRSPSPSTGLCGMFQDKTIYSRDASLHLEVTKSGPPSKLLGDR